mmetsp:Transcript_34051/g.76367  ORF Transcript_34051/g.76367 Transcript_34051/m.76367 type:complete len:106 (+) Transcript_34051:149-466(+)
MLSKLRGLRGRGAVSAQRCDSMLAAHDGEASCVRVRPGAALFTELGAVGIGEIEASSLLLRGLGPSWLFSLVAGSSEFWGLVCCMTSLLLSLGGSRAALITANYI